MVSIDLETDINTLKIKTGEFSEYTITEFYDLIFPNKSEIDWKPTVKYITNNILWKSLLIFGDKRTGKTELIRRTAEEAVHRYSKEELEALSMRGSHAMNWLGMPFMNFKQKKVLLLDDLTGQKMGKSQVENWFNMAHIMSNRIKSNNGLLMTFLATHDYFALDKRMRIGFDGMLVTSLTTNPSDVRWLTKVIGTEGVTLLHTDAMLKLNHQPYTRHVVFRVLDVGGYFTAELAKENYLESWIY